MTDPEQQWHGRIRSLDRRDKGYLIAPRADAKPVTQKTWTFNLPALDQGPTSECVGYSCFAYLLASPVRNMPRDKKPFDFYQGARQNDEWPGENYDGSSVRGGFKYLQSLGYVTGYKWAENCEAVVDHLLTSGPVVMGTDWHQGMDEADLHGYIWPTGEVNGGHAWLLLGANRARRNPDGTRGAARMINSWGVWGEGGRGRAWLTFQALDQLIQQAGEAAVATEIKI